MGSIKSADSDTVCAMKTFDNILHDFGLSQNNGKSVARLHGPIPAAEQTDSQQLNLSLVGSLPSLANALAASQIYELRGGAPQDVSVDGARGHNYLDPDVGMTPTINGQVSPAIINSTQKQWLNRKNRKYHLTWSLVILSCTIIFEPETAEWLPYRLYM